LRSEVCDAQRPRLARIGLHREAASEQLSALMLGMEVGAGVEPRRLAFRRSAPIYVERGAGRIDRRPRIYAKLTRLFLAADVIELRVQIVAKN
jgi:hypothetical protein